MQNNILKIKRKKNKRLFESVNLQAPPNTIFFFFFGKKQHWFNYSKKIPVYYFFKHLILHTFVIL